jgi:hypothetical protein
MSPNGAYIATQYTSNCHATSPLLLVVNVRAASSAFDPGEGDVLVLQGVRSVSLRWSNDQQLDILCSECTGTAFRTHKQQQTWRNMRIQYVFGDAER